MSRSKTPSIDTAISVLSSVLVCMGADHSNGAFFAEHDPAKALDFIRQQVWAIYGSRVTLLPSGRWGDSIALRATASAASQDSRRAQQIWSRVGPFLERGKPRSILLNGAPGGGKSTIVRRLIDLADGMGSMRVLQVGVSDFDYLRPSVVEAVVRLLKPDGIVINDFDRFGGADKLLDFFETARATTRLILATSNDSAQLSRAIRRPRRFDVIAQVDGVGEELAAHLFGERWSMLTAEQQTQVAAWPAVFVEELADLLDVLTGLVLVDEIAALQARVDEPDKKLIAIAPAITAEVVTP